MSAPKLKPDKLYPYQCRAVEHVAEHLPKKKSILVYAPVATGKTIILAEIARRYVSAGKRVLVLAHREELLTHAAQRLAAHGLEAGLIKAGWRHLEDAAARVQVASVQTLCRRKDRPRADVILIDEAHHTGAPSYRRLLQNYPRAWRVGFSGTPYYAPGTGGALADWYTEIFTTIEPEEAVENGWMAPYVGKVWVAPTHRELRKVGKKNGDFDQGALGELMSKRHIVGDIVAKWKKHARGRSTLLFAATIAQSKKMVDAFRKAGVEAEHLDGETRYDVRRSVLARFRAGEFPVLCNVGLFTEGTNVENVKCLVLARPTYSLGLFLQMVGRGRRPWNGEACIIHDHGNLVANHGLPDEPRDWKLGGKTKAQVVRCPKCSAVRPLRVKRCLNKACGMSTVEVIHEDPKWILKGYEYDLEQFAAMRADQRKKAQALREQGLRTVEIAKQLGLTSLQVYKLVGSGGVDPLGRGKWNLEGLMRSASRYETRSAWAKAEPAPYTKVAKLRLLDFFCAHMKCPTSSGRRGKMTPDAIAEMARLYRGGFSMREIAKRMGVSAPTVLCRLTQSGVHTKKKS